MPDAAFASVAVTVPLVVTALLGVLDSTVPSPVKVTLVTVPLVVDTLVPLTCSPTQFIVVVPVAITHVEVPDLLNMVKSFVDP